MTSNDANPSTHSPSTVFRDRGVIIANQQARIAELELACQRLRDDTQGAHAERDQAKAEVERLARSANLWCEKAEDFEGRYEVAHDARMAAEAGTAALRAQIGDLAESVERGSLGYSPWALHRVVDRLRALAGAPAVTPTETQAKDGA